MSLRILGGSAKGRSLTVPESARPSGARIRKSLFDLLAARAPAGRFPAFLDLHGGSGAIGLEAASRGHRVTLIEKELRASKAIEGNARALGLQVTVLRGESEKLLPQLGKFDLVFSDPPYEADIPKLTALLIHADLLRPGGLLICQHPTQVTLGAFPGYELETRKYGSNVLSLYTRHEPGAEPLESGRHQSGAHESASVGEE
ncbi:RsmD family RNA methyltransferase [Deinococcus sp.]|uniref:RsmD family RNA methyltransferase n=1 Tax=Deinococcus sp. TaxID=47478 RepID=UPI0025C33BE8|nr:RsmD family RNA methyltransferase [Deinococcus sp.]